MSVFKKTNKPSARLSNGQLILSLPDAMTPVVWMIDISNGGGFFIRVDKDDNGLYILQKVEGTGKNIKIEDIAYYADQAKASQAMMIIGHVLDRSGDKRSDNRSLSSKIIRLFLMFILIILAIFGLIGLYMVFINYMEVRNERIQQQAAQSQQQTIMQDTPPPPPPAISSDPNAVGVPLSADDYLQQRGSGLPF